jgi:predicted small lipoprotein YifL
MPKTPATLLLGLVLALVGGPACGRKGPLVLPPSRAPMAVDGLTAEAGEGGVLVRWTNPAKTVSGKPADPIETAEVWVFERELPPSGRPPSDEEVEKSGRLVRRIARAEFAAFAAPAGSAPGSLAFLYAPPSGAALPARLAFTVRVVDRKGRASDFAAPASVETVRRPPADGPSAPGRCMLGTGGAG